MLHSNERGYAVMNKSLDAISFDHYRLEKCKEYCGNGYVIAERIPKFYGINLRVVWHGHWYKTIKLNFWDGNIFWINWSLAKQFTHKTGKVVYQNTHKNK